MSETTETLDSQRIRQSERIPPILNSEWIRISFRNEVGRAMEEIDSPLIRNTLAQTRDSIIQICFELNLDRLPPEHAARIAARIIHDQVQLAIKEINLGALREANVNNDNRIRNLEEQLQSAMYDEKTGLYSARAGREIFFQRMSAWIRNVKAAPVPVSGILIDIDYFKKVNDTYGHLAGDKVLRAVADKIREIIPGRTGVDVPGVRWGGEEFLIVLGQCSETNAVEKADQLRRAVSEMNIPISQNGDKKFVKKTISIGVHTAVLNGGLMKEDDENHEEFIFRLMDLLTGAADKLLYESKKNGRNKITSETQDYPEIENPEENGVLY